MAKGILTPRVERTYALRDAAQAHRDLEARRTIGSVVLLP
jgi:NADPH2:quinone reductase